MSEITQFDNPLRYMVPSDSDKGEYLVELDAYGGNGKCTCKDFVCRKEPELKTGAKACEGLRCKHIKRARGKLVDQVIRQLSKLQNEPSKKEKPTNYRSRKTRI